MNLQYDALHSRSGFVDRSTRGRIRLTGADRRSYLQGLLTNDIAALEPGTGCYSAMLTANGRMITDMRVLELGDAILLDLPEQTATLVREKLETFVFSEDVTVADVAPQLDHFGLYGPQSATVLRAALSKLTAAGESAPTEDRLRTLRFFDNTKWDVHGEAIIVAKSDDFGLDGFEMYVPRASASALQTALIGAGAVTVDEQVLETCRIEAGRPEFGIDMTDDTIPLEAGIEERAISHTKGCYVGQEIIIRVLHRGHGRVARRLVTILVDGRVPSRADKILAAEKEIGFVTSATHSPAAGQPIALGYVHRDFAHAGTTVLVATSDGIVGARVK
jgi:folate-binding protein YgfZ